MSNHWKFAIFILLEFALLAFTIGTVRGRGLSAELVKKEQLMSAVGFGVLWLAYQCGVIVAAVITRSR